MKTKSKIHIINFNDNNKIQIKRKNYFYLGTWCKKISNPLNLDLRDTLNMYSVSNKNKQLKNIKFEKKIYSTILNLLVKNLNIIHKKNYSKKFWEILLWRWLSELIRALYFRWEYINKINSKYEIKSLLNLNYSKKKIIPLDTNDAHEIFLRDNRWNELIFNEIINYQNKKINNFYKKSFKQFTNKEKKLKIDFPIYATTKNVRKIYIYRSCLNKILLLKIRQKYKCLYFNFFKTKEIENVSNNFRKELSKLISKKKKLVLKNFKNFLLSKLVDNVPKIFIENFEQLEREYKKSKWPENPKYILTSYGHFYDELFKYFVADKTENYKKINFFILQHGYANMFLNNSFYLNFYDSRISSGLITWGGKKNNKYLKPFFYPKIYISNVDQFTFDDLKNIVIISYNFNSQIYLTPNGSMDYDSANQIMLFNMFKFLEPLKKEFHNKIYLRHNNVRLQNNNFEKTLINNFKFIKFDDIKNNFKSTLKKYNLFIHFFFGTPFFECMAMNKPSIIIYNQNFTLTFDHKFILFLKKLEDIKILFKNSYDASNFLNQNYSNLNEWWNSKKLQRIRIAFCNEYCHITNKHLSLIDKIFK